MKNAQTIIISDPWEEVGLGFLAPPSKRSYKEKDLIIIVVINVKYIMGQSVVRGL